MTSIPPPPGMPGSTAAGGALRPVCFVDDDSAVRDSATLLLGAHGYDAIGHASGADVLADHRRHEFACLIFDHHMPGMSGLDMLAALRREGSAVPAILITGRIDPYIRAGAQTLGVGAILEKPFSGIQLIEVVRAHLGRSA